MIGLQPPHIPALPARWPEKLDLDGRRLGVVGSCASAMQLVPEVADIAADVTVFQRSPQWALPNRNYLRPVDPAVALLMAQVPGYAAWYRLRLQWTYQDRAPPDGRTRPCLPAPEDDKASTPGQADSPLAQAVSPREVPAAAVGYAAQQVEVQADQWAAYDWQGDRIKRHRKEIRKAFGFRAGTEEDQEWLTAEMCGVELSRDRLAEAVVVARCRNDFVEPPRRPRPLPLFGR